MIMNLCEISPDPIGDIQPSIGAQREEVVGCDRLGLASSLKHEKLRENGDGF
jgi:hypothetical protein